jgi:hypothetical protein
VGKHGKIEIVFKLEPLHSIMNFKIGDTVQYERWDGEEGRSYGWFLATKQAKIVSICYKLDNGDTIEGSKLTLVAPKEQPKEPQKEEPTESKSDPTKSS